MLESGPLGSEYEKIPGVRQAFDWQTVVSNWYTYLWALSNHNQRLGLISQLSAPQVVSLRLLEEWWWYGCDTSTRSAIISPNTAPQLDPSDARYLYYKKVYQLWLWEFTGVFHTMEADRTELRMAYLTNVRQGAAKAAAVHRTALAAYKFVVDKQLSLASASVFSSKINPLPPVRLGACIPACVEPCPWIGRASLEKQFPYYLWDKQEACTVHFEEDVNVPPYTVISHTWGRFKIKNEYDSLPNRVDWHIPRLRPEYLFHVKDLPDILSRVPTPTRYIWFDLVCIPQDGRPLQDIEIGRQAGIFVAAKFAVVWLNQVRGWRGLQSAVMWSALEYLSHDQNDKFGTADLLPHLKDEAGQASGLTIPAREEDEGTPESAWVFQDQNDRTVTPDRWFTSLWTLQEACLRPDMILCDREWNVLSLGEGECQMPIPLDHLVALFERPYPPKLKDVPASVHEVKLLLSSSSLRALLNMDPIDIIILGEMRYCEDTNRAVAIMSALGAVDWHTKSSPDSIERNPKELVLGKYPQAFLQECHRRFGSVLFSSYDVLNLEDVFYEAPVLDEDMVDSLRGSLLPFSLGVQDPRFMAGVFMCIEDHPSVATWLIERDGSTLLPHAGLVASYFGLTVNSGHVDADIRPRRRDLRNTRSLQDLNDWMGSFRPNSEKHAVCLFQNQTNSCWGVILERLDPGENNFLNVGTFDTPEYPVGHPCRRFMFPATVQVNWRVI